MSGNLGNFSIKNQALFLFNLLKNRRFASLASLKNPDLDGFIDVFQVEAPRRSANGSSVGRTLISLPIRLLLRFNRNSLFRKIPTMKGHIKALRIRIQTTCLKTRIFA
jgi:hypothetical protein